MAKLKKRDDGRYQTTFRYDGKQYNVCGRTKQELESNKAARIERLKSGEQRRANPTLDQYYDTFRTAPGKGKGSHNTHTEVGIQELLGDFN